MEKSENNYIIDGGQLGKERLDVLSEVLNSYTKSLFEINGIFEGQKFLDVGCGGGNVSLMAANIVGESGRVLGVDFDKEIILLAQKEAYILGVKNVQFKVMNVYNIVFENDFDIVYARFLLSHLNYPKPALEKMLTSIKPGGKIIVEDVQFSGHFCYPECKAFDSYIYYYSAAAKNNNQDVEIGASLYKLFHLAGIRRIKFDMIQPCFNDGIGKLMAYLTLDRVKNTVIKQGLATAKTISEVLQELEEFTKNELTIISFPRIFRVWGEKS